MIELRGYQDDSVKETSHKFTLLDKFKKAIRVVLLVITGGGGKCHGKDTPILMYDGSIKMVQDIKKGDLLMGDDSTPRKVLSTCTGRENIYEIKPIKGDKWTCNESHILSLVNTSRDEHGFIKGEPKNISLKEYKEYKGRKRDLALYKVPVEFKKQKVEIDPYFLGLWIGDGTQANINITLPDKEIHRYLKKFAKENGLYCQHMKYGGKRCESIFFKHSHLKNKKLVKIFRRKKLIINNRLYNEKFIPSEYLINSREVRLQMLAGLLDTDGYFNEGTYEIVTKFNHLCDQILFLARSLGYAAYTKKKIGTIKSINFKGEYNRITISGHVSEIPCKIKRKQAPKRKQIKNVLRTGFKTESIGAGDYYGFELDGNGLYLLGDFTVTHNTTIAGYMIYNAQKKGIPCLFIAHRIELIKQAQARMEKEFGIKSGIIMGDEKPNPFALVQVASIQTLQRREQPPAGLVIIDEAHRAISNGYMKVIAYYQAQGAYIVGLTGTPFSANKRVGLNTLYQDYVSNIKCSELLAIGAIVPVKAYGAESVSSKGMKTLGGDFRQDELMKAFDRENVYINLIFNFERKLKNKKTIVFCSSVEHSIKVTEEFLKHGYRAAHIDGNTPSKERDNIVEGFRGDDIQILVNCSIACEGLDIPNCEGEIMAVATKSKIKYLQCVWRIMRPYTNPVTGEKKTHGIFIDMADNYERFRDIGILPDGDIEVSLEPETTTESSGVGPVKICPSCSYMNHASVCRCEDCGNVFTKTKKEIQEEEFIELQRDNKERRWKKYKQKDWYKVKTEELEAFAKVKGYKSFWVTQEKERRKNERKIVKIKDFDGSKQEYYKKAKELENLYYGKKIIEGFAYEKEDKQYLIFRQIKITENETTI